MPTAGCFAVRAPDDEVASTDVEVGRELSTTDAPARASSIGPSAVSTERIVAGTSGRTRTASPGRNVPDAMRPA